ncbi:MAG TPA: HAD family phosphatase [Patescibacteria group bacterium]|nr:HAD family phosphatase [Patescibacteria group bacterium]
MAEIKEVLFDWDGTVANTEPISLTVTRKVLSDYANSIFGKPMTAEIDALDMRGKDFGQIAKQFEKAVNAGLPENSRVTLDIEDLRINKLRPLTKEALLDAELAKGIGSAWAELQDDMGLGVAIVSNSPRLRIQPLLEKHDFTTRIPAPRLFSAFEDVAKLKEDPAIYLLAAQKLGITPDEAAAVEDSATGMRAAKSAGIGLRVGFTGLTEHENAPALKQVLLDEGAHIVIDDMRQLPQAIRAYKAGSLKA